MLNTKAFVVLAGNPTKWDEELIRRCRPGCHEGTYNSDDLCKVQAEQHAKGRRTAVLTESVYGWSVRDGSGLDGFCIIAGARNGTLDGSKQAAIKWGTNWANEDPERREFIATKDDLAKKPEDEYRNKKLWGGVK